MILLQLFWSFIKVGFTSFGGLSMLPVVSSEMTSHGWMSAEEVTNLVAIAEMTPGPIGLNCASFAGMRCAGLIGAVVANLGILFPTFSLGLIAAISFSKLKDSKIAEKLLTGIRPACIGMIFGIVLNLCFLNYSAESVIGNLSSIIIGILSLYLLLKKVSIPLVIIISGAIGVCFHMLPMII